METAAYGVDSMEDSGVAGELGVSDTAAEGVASEEGVASVEEVSSGAEVVAGVIGVSDALVEDADCGEESVAVGGAVGSA